MVMADLASACSRSDLCTDEYPPDTTPGCQRAKHRAGRGKKTLSSRAKTHSSGGVLYQNVGKSRETVLGIQLFHRHGPEQESGKLALVHGFRLGGPFIVLALAAAVAVF